MATTPEHYCNDCGERWSKDHLNGVGVCPECAEEHDAWEDNPPDD